MVRCFQPEAISFRTTIRRLLKNGNFPTLTTAVFDINKFLNELEAKCVKVNMVQMIDLDFLVMKMLGTFYKHHGGKAWHKLENLHSVVSSREERRNRR